MLGALIAFVLAQGAFGQQLNLGDICEIGVESLGTCTELSKCPNAQESIFCDESKSIVCCPEVPVFRPVCEGRSGGRQKRKTHMDYVFGGTLAKINEFPHLVAIGFNSKGDITWECGGTFITSRFVLTAAHCLSDPRNHEKVAQLVKVGDLDLLDHSDDQGTQIIPIIERIPHPEYDPKLLYNDIALLELEESVLIVSTPCIQISRSMLNLNPIIVGWGKTGEGRQYKDQKLKKAETEFQSMDKCEQVSKRFSATQLNKVLPNGLNNDSMICAGKLEGGVDTCKGDSGGPLQQAVITVNCLYNIVGVTSFGYKCGRANTPSIYTRISYYLPWIESKVCSVE